MATTTGTAVWSPDASYMYRDPWTTTNVNTSWSGMLPTTKGQDYPTTQPLLQDYQAQALPTNWYGGTTMQSPNQAQMMQSPSYGPVPPTNWYGGGSTIGGQIGGAPPAYDPNGRQYVTMPGSTTGGYGGYSLPVPQPGAMPPGATAPTLGGVVHPGDQATWDWYRNNSGAVNSWLPYAQFMQNQQQYSLDFNEAQRRWNEQFGWTQQQDQFNMGLAGRQQTMAEWQAQQAAQQWAQQFGWTQQTDQFNMGLAQQQQDWTQQYQGGQLAIQQQQANVEQMYRMGQITNEQRQIALAELTQQQNNSLAQQAQSWTQQYQGGQLQLQQQANQVEQMYRMGQLTNEQRQIALAEITQQQNNALAQQQQAWQQQYQGGQLGLQAQELASRDWYQRAQTDIAAKQANIDEMYRMGQLTNEQRSIALAELTQQQQNAFQYAQLAQQGGLASQELVSQDWYRRQQADIARAELAQTGYLQNRELDVRDWYQRQQADIARGQLTVDAMYRSGQISAQQRELALAELTQQQSNALAQAQFGWQQQYAQMQMAQEAAIARERMQSEQQMAAMQAFGRAYAPNVRAIRSWA